MMKSKMCTDSVSPNQERLIIYKKFAVAFSYPANGFLEYFPDEKIDELALEFDRLFRAKEIWLYTTEYTSENEFQRVNSLSDITGFYRAFGLQTNEERPDFLATELEFMHYLIFKEDYAIRNDIKDAKNKVFLCIDAQNKFFSTHLFPAAKKICEKIVSQEHGFYKKRAKELLNFLEKEKSQIPYLKKLLVNNK